jgi:UDP-N-acetylmuramoylalanine--D-glutamate ligase
LELLKEYSAETIFVCELSSYQLTDIQYSPHIAVVVSLFPEHLDYHGNLENYYAAKENIIRFSRLHDYFIYNPRVAELKSWIMKTKAKALQYQADFIPESKNLIGAHNQDNIRAAITVAHLFHVSNKQISEALETFTALPHRLQNIGTYNGITFYDDAISTTPESTIAALEALKNVKTIFLGGKDRSYNFHNLVAVLKRKGIESIVLFPDTGSEIAKELEATMNYNPVILHTNDMEKAVQFAYTHTPEGSICLLSTASPSYSIWKNFEEKGDLFQLYVKQYSHEKTNS